MDPEAKAKDPRRDVGRLNAAPRCGARNRRGKPCQCPAVRGKARCRMHGGAKGSGAPKGARNGAYRTGLHTYEARALRALISNVLKPAN
jgi:hypothetical protein